METIRERVAKGSIAICANINHKALRPCGVEKASRPRSMPTSGTSSSFPDIEPELAKLDEAVKCGAHVVMDLLTGDHIDELRVSASSSILPSWSERCRSMRRPSVLLRSMVLSWEMTDDDILQTIEKQAKDGADFMTLHCGGLRWRQSTACGNRGVSWML